MKLPGEQSFFRAFDAQLGMGCLWRVRNNISSADLYLERMDLDGILHISVHQSGQIHYAVERYLHTQDSIQPRHLEISRGVADYVLGWQLPAQIRVPKSSLSWEAVIEHQDEIRVPVSKHSQGVQMMLLVQSEATSILNLENGFLVDEFRLSDGRTAALVAVDWFSETDPYVAYADLIQKAKQDLQHLTSDLKLARITVAHERNLSTGTLAQLELLVAVGK